MLFQFAENTIVGIVFSVILVLGAYFFGDPFFFDPLLLVAFVAIALFFRRNKDLLYISSLFIVERSLEEMLYRTIQNEIWFKLPSYLVLCILVWQCSRKDDWLRWFALGFLGFALATEFYWYAIDYKAPLILWTCLLFTLTVGLRWAIRRRMFWMYHIFKEYGQPLALDHRLLFATNCFIAIHVFMVLEFYLRHLLGYKSITFIYYSYPYIAHTITTFIVYNVIIESIKHLKKVELPA